jgi:hypothetical protein
MKSFKIINIAFLASLFFVTGLFTTYSEAQPSKVAMGRSFSEGRPKGACRIDPSIIFTEEQTKELENLQRAYLEKAKPLWSELRDLRLELRFAVTDPQVQVQALLEKQRKFIALHSQFENLVFSYQLKVRAIFTKEQFERFPAECPLKMGIGYGAGRGFKKGLQRGDRW